MKWFVRISRICLGLFLIALAILIGFSLSIKTEEVELPALVGIFLFLSIFASAICILVAVVIDIVESYRTKGFSFIIGYIAEIAVVWIVYIIYNYCVGEGNLNFPQSLVQPVIIVCAIRAGRVILAKKRW